jgi:hypothetical protein
LEVVEIRNSILSNSDYEQFKPVTNFEADNHPSLINILSSRTASIIANN